jgi:hypothetical protein
MIGALGTEVFSLKRLLGRSVGGGLAPGRYVKNISGYGHFPLQYMGPFITWYLGGGGGKLITGTLKDG